VANGQRREAHRTEVRVVVASHKRPENEDAPKIIEETRKYIRDFDRLVKSTSTAQELYDKMLALYPNRVNPGWALWGCGEQFLLQRSNNDHCDAAARGRHDEAQLFAQHAEELVGRVGLASELEIVIAIETRFVDHRPMQSIFQCAAEVVHGPAVAARRTLRIAVCKVYW
jgi:hypothetical protein